LQQNSKNNTSSVWVHLNKHSYNLIDPLINKSGFKLHYAKGEDVSLYRWMREGKKDLVPAYSTHVISCGGVIVNENKILLVEEKSVQRLIFRVPLRVNSEYQEVELTRPKVSKNAQRDRSLKKSVSPRSSEASSGFASWQGTSMVPLICTMRA
jgi:hypothetical protein